MVESGCVTSVCPVGGSIERSLLTLCGRILSSFSPLRPPASSSFFASSVVFPFIRASVCARKFATRIYRATHNIYTHSSASAAGGCQGVAMWLLKGLAWFECIAYGIASWLPVKRVKRHGMLCFCYYMCLLCVLMLNVAIVLSLFCVLLLCVLV